MPTKELATISKPRVSSSDLARKWLVTFAEMCQREVTPALVQIWAQALGDIPPDRLQLACDRLAKTWTSNFLPVPGNVRAQLDQAEAKAFDLQAEAEWDRVLEGIHWSAPRRFPAATEHAIRAAGGIRFLERCDESELVWCRKTFLAAYKNVHETGQVEHLLGNGEAKTILRRLSAGPPVERKILHTAEEKSNAPTSDEVRAVLEKIAKPAPATVAAPTEEELAARWARQKRALFERAAALGLGAKTHAETSDQTLPIAPIPRGPCPGNQSSDFATQSGQ